MKSNILNFCLLALFAQSAFASGKNKIQYQNLDWAIYETTHFKIFYYSAEKHMLPDVVNMVESAYAHNSDKLQHQLNFKVPFVFFKTHEEFSQTNIFEGFVPRAVGAFAEPFQSRMVLPLDGGPEDNYALILHELTHIFQFDMLYNNKISTILRAQTPTWFTEGMASYVADDENNLETMFLRDAAISSNFRALANFSGFSYLAYRIGHAAFDFIEETYGIEGVRNFLWQYRKNITGSVSSAIERAFDLRAEDFDRAFQKYLRKRYIGLLVNKEEPDDNAREIRTRRVVTTLSPELSPSGDLFAAIVPIKNELDLVLVSTKDGKIFKNLTKGYSNLFSEIYVGAFKGVNDLSWNTDGNEIAFAGIKEGTNLLFVVNVLNGKIIEELKFHDLRDAQAPSFSVDGRSIYFAANSNGLYDIWRYNRDSKELTNLTKDDVADRNPRLSPDGKEIVYSSLRNGFYKIFVLDLTTGKKTQLTSGLGNDIQASYSPDMKRLFYSSDRFDDIYNIYELQLDSGEIKRYTNLMTGAFSPQERVTYDPKESQETRQLIFTAYYQGRFRVYRMDKPEIHGKPYDSGSDNFANVKKYDFSRNIEMDPAKYKAYKPLKNIGVSNVGVSAGVTSDGRFLSNSYIGLSDTMGDQTLDIQIRSVSSQESYLVSYLNKKRRFNWGLLFASQGSYIVDNFTSQRIDRTFKSQYLAGLLSYPLSTFNRIETGAGYRSIDSFSIDLIENIDENGAPIDPNKPDFYLAYVPFNFSSAFAFLNFSRDTIRYREYGAQQGMGFDIGVTETFGENTAYNLQLRTYKELTRRSLIAWRTIFDRSEGDQKDIYSLGGDNNLRGAWDYNEFVGSNRFLTQFELRFPVIDALVFPGFSFDTIRGTLFVEAGGTWFKDELFHWDFQSSKPTATAAAWNPERPDTNYLIGSYGLEISMVLLGLDVHFTWSKRTNFDDFPTNSRYSFWIGRSF